MEKYEIIRRLEKIASHAIHFVGEPPFVMSLDDGIAVKDAVELLKEHEHSGTWEWITEDEYRCSECKSVTYVDECMNEPQYLYCPYCGCKMTFEGNWVRRE